MTGTIKRIFSSKGYGFIKDDEDKTRFFHAGEAPQDWDRLHEGQRVTFEPLDGPTPDKLRASQVRICSN